MSDPLGATVSVVDAKVERVREAGGVRHKALVIAYGVHATGRREVIGIDVGEAETESFWRAFLRSLRARGLDGVQLVISDAHTGLVAAIAKVLGCRWQRCTVHFLRDMLGHVARAQQPLVSGAIRQIFTAGSATRRTSGSAGRRPAPPPHASRLPGCWRTRDRPAGLLRLPAETGQSCAPPPTRRVNREIGRSSDVVGISPTTPPAAPGRDAAAEQNESGWSAAATCQRPP